jgi:hypothetical protein
MLRWSLWEGLRYSTTEGVRTLRELPNLLAYLALELLPCALAVVALRRHLAGSRRLLAGGWIVVSLAATAAGGRFYWHYFTLVSLPLAVIAGIAAPALWDRRSRRWHIAAVVLALLPTLASQAWLWRQEHAGYGSLRASHRELAREALRHLRPGDGLVAFGSAAPIYYLTGRSAPTPYVVTDHLFGDVDPNLLAEPDDIRRHADPERLAAFVSALARREVRVVVDAPLSAWRGYSLERIPEVATAVRANFWLAHRATSGAVWVRR